MTKNANRGAAAEPVAVTIDFGARFASSEQFKAIYREGMALVEETAAYLDGEGRQEARALPSQAALIYATESMRLTTRLMQLASWLLVRRAVNNGELTAQQALEEKHKIKLRDVARPGHTLGFGELPSKMQTLIERSFRLQDRIQKLDALIHAEAEQRRDAARNPVAPQMDRLRAAFEA